MKIQKLAFLSLFVLLFQANLFSQTYAFKVMVNKGKTEIKSGAAWVPMKVGLSLGDNDEVRLAENSYLGLVNSSGKPLELKQAGRHTVKSLLAKIGPGTTVLNKYTDFILSSAAEPKTGLTATGAVHRGQEISLHMPKGDKGIVFGNEVIVNWDNKALLPPYKVVFQSFFEDELYSVETKNNYVTINLNDKNFSNEDNILVVVTSLSDSKVSEKHTIRKMSKNDNERIKSAIKENNIDVNVPTALGKLFLARFYEEHGLLINAATVLQQATILEPDVPAYQEAYLDFLYRTGLKEGTAQQK
jgi:hypothetical protein